MHDYEAVSNGSSDNGDYGDDNKRKKEEDDDDDVKEGNWRI